MAPQIPQARKGIITDQMLAVAKAENRPAETSREGVALGRIVIPWTHTRKPKAVGIGKGLRTKVNASIGTSSDSRTGIES